jgi:hypothetical protein
MVCDAEGECMRGVKFGLGSMCFLACPPPSDLKFGHVVFPGERQVCAIGWGYWYNKLIALWVYVSVFSRGELLVGGRPWKCRGSSRYWACKDRGSLTRERRSRGSFSSMLGAREMVGGRR